MAGVAFGYEPVIAPTIMGAVPASIIEAQRDESEKAAKEAVARFDEAARRDGLSARVPCSESRLAGAASGSRQSRGASTSRSSARPSRTRPRPRG